MTTHLRFEHPDHGPVHVYRRPEWDAGAGVAIYLHGWNLGKRIEPWYVDQAVVEVDLKAKVESSYSNATVVAIATREGRGKPIHWQGLGELLSFLSNQLGEDLYTAPVHALGHSGAYANIKLWLEHPQLDHVSRLDALYGYFKSYTDYARNVRHRFDLAVSRGSKPHTNAYRITRQLDEYHVLQHVPKGLTPAPICRVLYLPAPLKHMDWVLDPFPIPFLLHRAELLRAEG